MHENKAAGTRSPFAASAKGVSSPVGLRLVIFSLSFSLFLRPLFFASSPCGVVVGWDREGAGQRGASQNSVSSPPFLHVVPVLVAVVSSTIFISAQLCTLRVPPFSAAAVLCFVCTLHSSTPIPSLSLASAVLVAPLCPLFAFHSHKHCATSLKTSQLD